MLSHWSVPLAKIDSQVTSKAHLRDWAVWRFLTGDNVFYILLYIFSQRSILMDPKTILRFEGIALFGAATVAYFVLGAPVWLFVVLALVPDLSMLGYLAGARAGSSLYNAFHTYVAPIAFGAVGFWTGTTPLVWVALVWIAHIGMDRAVGYGLKYPTGFKHTHLTHEDSHSDPVSERIGGHVDPIPVGDD